MASGDELTEELRKLALKSAGEKVAQIDEQHRGRARTLSEFEAKLLLKRRGALPKNFEEWSQDMDIIKRAALHIGACQGLNEVKAVLWPEPAPEGSVPPLSPP